MKYFEKTALSKGTLMRSLDKFHTKRNVLSHLPIKESPVIDMQKKFFSGKMRKIIPKINEKSLLKVSVIFFY